MHHVTAGRLHASSFFPFLTKSLRGTASLLVVVGDDHEIGMTILRHGVRS